MRILAADVGGTNARLALFDTGPEGLRPLVRRVYRSRRYSGLVPILREFLNDEDVVAAGAPEAACLGLACPIVEERCELPNLDWVVDRRQVAEAIGLPGTRLINDFDAVGHGLEALGGEDVAELQAGEPVDGAPIAVIGAGTGLGVAFLTRGEDEGRYRVHSSEGGHVDFAPRTELQVALWTHLRARFGRVSCERVLSGPGLVNVYEFLVSTGREAEAPKVRKEMEGDDPALVVSRHGARGDDPACSEALRIFLAVFGAQAGDLALMLQARGGVFLAGGIAPDLLDPLREGPFLEAFREKGRMADLVRRIPVRVILNEDAGLLGAAVAAVTTARRRP